MGRIILLWERLAIGDFLHYKSGAMTASDRTLLERLAASVRRARRRKGITRAELARRSGLSERYLARVESGDGNISVLRLAALAGALRTSADALLRDTAPEPAVVSLVGLRGAGKSTVGPLLAARLGAPFVELDDRVIEASGGLPLDEIFELHGEGYYRRLEREAVRGVLAEPGPAVIAAAGGIVHDRESWELVTARTTVVWLRARPEDHWNRVVAQGDRRPMGDNPAAMDELRALLRSREPFYRRAAVTVETWRLAPDEIAARIAEAIGDGVVEAGEHARGVEA